MTTTTDLIEHDDKSITLSEQRKLIILESAWEIAEDCKILMNCMREGRKNDDPMWEVAARGLLMRMEAVSGYVMDVFAADVSTHDLSKRLLGRFAA